MLEWNSWEDDYILWTSDNHSYNLEYLFPGVITYENKLFAGDVRNWFYYLYTVKKESGQLFFDFDIFKKCKESQGAPYQMLVALKFLNYAYCLNTLLVDKRMLKDENDDTSDTGQLNFDDLLVTCGENAVPFIENKALAYKYSIYYNCGEYIPSDTWDVMAKIYKELRK